MTDAPPELPTPDDPMAVARRYVLEHHADRDEVHLLRRHAGLFYRWDGACWPELPDADLRSSAYTWTEPAVYWKTTKDGPELTPWAPTRYKIDNTVDALRAVGHLDSSVTAPAWIDEPVFHPHPPAGEVVAMRNGLLHLPTRELVAHTPAFWTHHSLPFDFDPGAPAPTRWLAFLEELWGDDVESIATLQEMFGYVLSGDTAQQKMFLLVGPKRSGKGTIGRVLTGLLGRHNVAAPTLAGMATNFGLSPLIDRPLALISDARLSGRTDSSLVVERLLSITGEDALTIDRKYREPWTGRLPARFVILTNELPRLSDSSGALAFRFVALVLTRSFYGHENPLLTDQLLTEAPAIFNWTLDGLDRLVERGYFVVPASARESIEALHDLSSPVAAFIRERCHLAPGASVLVDDLFGHWQKWCTEQGNEHCGAASSFAVELRSAVPTLRKVRLREDNRRARYLGLDLGDPPLFEGASP